ncbi:MAG: DNA gyrase inhibitor YacG [Planctomycetaceae bacterium]
MIRPHHCPICDKAFQQSAGSDNSYFPFCSDRCRKVDLFRWFDGRYAVVEDLDPQVAEFLRHDPDIEVQESGDAM